MKKAISIALVLAMAVSFTACGKVKPTTVAQPISSMAETATDVVKLEKEIQQLKIKNEQLSNELKSVKKNGTKEYINCQVSAHMIGGFDAQINEIILDGGNLPTIIMAQCFQDEPFLFRVTPEVGKQLKVNEGYHFDIKKYEIGLVATSEIDKCVSPRDLDHYHYCADNFRLTNENEGGLNECKIKIIANK